MGKAAHRHGVAVVAASVPLMADAWGAGVFGEDGRWAAGRVHSRCLVVVVTASRSPPPTQVALASGFARGA